MCSDAYLNTTSSAAAVSTVAVDVEVHQVVFYTGDDRLQKAIRSAFCCFAWLSIRSNETRFETS